MNVVDDNLYHICYLQKVTGSQSVYPVCIRQIQDHPGEEFKPFGAQTQFVRLFLHPQ